MPAWWICSLRRVWTRFVAGVLVLEQVGVLGCVGARSRANVGPFGWVSTCDASLVEYRAMGYALGQWVMTWRVLVQRASFLVRVGVLVRAGTRFHAGLDPFGCLTTTWRVRLRV